MFKTGNDIETKGAVLIGELLKTNSSLKTLNLECGALFTYMICFLF